MIVFSLIHRWIHKSKISNHSIINKKTKINDYCNIHKHVNIINSEIGLATFIGSNSYLPHSQIGKFCSISTNVKLILYTHPSKHFVSTHPAFYSLANQSGIRFTNNQKFQESLIDLNNISLKIGNDVWIGADVTILGNIEIGDGAIIGCGALVTKSVAPYSIVGGVPAKIIRYRFTNEQITILNSLKWWNKSINWIKSNANLFTDIDSFITNINK